MSWSALLARSEAGTLPALAALLGRGARARVTPTADSGAPSLWPTIATGFEPARHGIFADQQPWAGGMRPTGRAGWHTAPLWQRFALAGVATIGVGWPYTWPGADWPGIHADDRLGEAFGQCWDDWYLPTDVAPAAARELVRDLRVHPSDISGEMLLPFVPRLAEVDQRRDRGLIDIALAIARFSTEMGAFSRLLAEQPWQFATLYSGFLQSLQSRFEGAAPPFDRVVDAAWSMVDGAVHLLGQALGAQGTLVLVSAGRAGEAGVLVAAGPGLPEGTELPPLRSIDIAPSLLARFGLRDAAHPGVARLNSTATLREAPRPPAPPGDPAPDARDLERVRAHGFEPPKLPAAPLARQLLLRAEALLAIDPVESGRLAEQALALSPESPLAIGLLAGSRAMAEDFSEFPAFADRIEAASPGHAWAPLIRAAYHASRREPAAAIPLLRAAKASGGPREWIRAAAVWMMLRRPSEARKLFARIVEHQPDWADAWAGLAMSSGARHSEAEAAFRRALALDPANAAVREGLARLLRRMARHGEADAIERQAAA